MPQFHYKILNNEGKTVEGTMESKDKFSLYHALKEDGSTVVSAEEVKSKKSGTFMGLELSGKIKTHDKIVFARNLSKMIEAGLPMTRALAILEKQSKRQFKKVISGISDSISKGKTLSDSMKDYPKIFSELFVSMVRAGEESGNLATALQSISQQMEKSYQLTKKVRGAMMYPSIIISLMIVIGVLMMVYMVPTLTETFVGLGVELPLSTRIIIAVSDFMRDYFIFAVPAVLLLVGLLVMFLRTSGGKRSIDTMILNLPIISPIVREINSARTARTLSSLLSSGVDIVVAIGVTEDVIQNSYYKDVLKKAGSAIQKGEQMSSIFAENEKLYPPFVSEMVSVGEETGKIGEMLSSVAVFYEDEVDQKTKDMSSIIEPVLMIVIGIAVAFFALSMLGPTYSLADSL